MTNVGSADRIVRFIVGAVLVAAPFLPFLAGSLAAWGAWKFALLAIGLVLIGTAAMRTCPLYSVLGINTWPLEKR